MVTCEWLQVRSPIQVIDGHNKIREETREHYSFESTEGLDKMQLCALVLGNVEAVKYVQKISSSFKCHVSFVYIGEFVTCAEL